MAIIAKLVEIGFNPDVHFFTSIDYVNFVYFTRNVHSWNIFYTISVFTRDTASTEKFCSKPSTTIINVSILDMPLLLYFSIPAPVYLYDDWIINIP